MIETFRSKRDDQYYFRIKALNHKVIAQSEGYVQKASRDRGVAALVKALAAGDAPIKDLGAI